MTHADAAGSSGFFGLTLMWFVMMAAMMAPTVWPWIRSVHHLSGDESSSPTLFAGQFTAGYLVAWLGYSALAALLQLTLVAAAMLDPISGMTSWAGATVFAVAGVYQFVPLKRACLTHCRSPLGYFLARWRGGRSGAFRMGLDHGVYCVGCCWALMAVVLAVGVMNRWWMGALTAIALVEQVAPSGHTLRQPLGIALLVAGLWRLSSGG
jgi:predicted metal-binding membrane protein